MIARLHGRVVGVDGDTVVVDVGGVGYRVRVPASMLPDLEPEGAPVTLHTRLIVRENEVALYGATDAPTMALFDVLISVSGIGPRLALAMLSALGASVLVQAIEGEDKTALTRVPGVGRRTAERIALELKGRLATFDREGGVRPPAPRDTIATEAEAALLGLGYTRGEAERALAATAAAQAASVEARILAALRWLSA